MINLDINNKTKFRIPRKKLEGVVNLAQKMIKKKDHQLVSLAFVSPSVIKKLNKAYRKKDSVTDVLSFENIDKPLMSGESFGEIIICPQRAQVQAKEYEHSFEKELVRLTLHGFLHLNSYDHIKKKDAVIMEYLEDKIMVKYYV